MPSNAGRITVRELDSGRCKYALNLRKIGGMRRSPFSLEILNRRKSQISLSGNLALRPFQKSPCGSALLGCDHAGMENGLRLEVNQER